MRNVALVVTAGLTVLLGALTRARTEVFRTERAYLEDIVRKAPSARALMNTGLLYMGEGNLERALDLYEQTLLDAPQWYTLHINLGILHRTRGDLTAADHHMALAVRYDWHSGVARVWRGEHHLKLGRFAEARDDFEAADAVSLDRYRIAKGLATAWAGLGESERSLTATRRCLTLDEVQAWQDIPEISTPFFAAGERQAHAGLRYYEALDRQRPDTWWIVYNIGTLAGQLGDTWRKESSHARAERLRAGLASQ